MTHTYITNYPDHYRYLALNMSFSLEFPPVSHWFTILLFYICGIVNTLLNRFTYSNTTALNTVS